MKKIILVFSVIVFVFVGCKKKEAVRTEEVSCKEDILAAINDPKNIDNMKIAALLKSCGQVVCENDSLLTQVEGLHVKKAEDYKIMLENFWGKGKTPDYKECKWLDINKLLESHCYDHYISFNYNVNDNTSSKEITIIPVSDFTIDTTCYSVPLFKSIKLNHKEITENTVIKFTKAKNEKGKTIIVFEIDGSKFLNGFYDISSIPPFTNTNYIEFMKDIAAKL